MREDETAPQGIYLKSTVSPDGPGAFRATCARCNKTERVMDESARGAWMALRRGGWSIVHEPTTSNLLCGACSK